MGALGDATAHATHAAELASTAGMPDVEARARYDLVRLDVPLHAAQPAAPDGGTGLLARAALALSLPDRATELAEVASDLAAAGDDLLAAEAATVAARRLRRAGFRERAEVTAAMAGTLRAMCGDPHTPLLGADDATRTLTPREREVLLLAARYTTKQIAQRLGLAVPTVNNTLARAYAKSGISGRAQLRSLLHEST
jgi:DNA-binding CsgD family transcriptional regulator